MLKKILIANPLGWFIYTTLGKFKVMTMVAIVVVTFWVLKGLASAGVLNAFSTTLTQGFMEIKGVAQHCVPKIMDIEEMWDCIKNVPTYQPVHEEINLEKTLQRIYQQDNMISPFDEDDHPYDEDDEPPATVTVKGGRGSTQPTNN